ncbi:MAG: hypothetical protein IKU15_09135 [Clostridia bacterium]|nr:hypothetical protein [Clostridia bacterium]
MKKVRNYDYIVTTADGESRVFRTWSTADFYRQTRADKVTSFTKVHQTERYSK